ncbi:CcdB family protein [Thiohalophilus sp.]|uniref:CcdB family protein n=1 Tax=Thiohalophilus sp. TaxID=3028392 RepID=UPI002ACDAF62|nr:CcdB family protein [Thiohalophilus sp.]MDZ7803505.1 CcdB family protein [Thiohalophilus sp.]
MAQFTLYENQNPDSKETYPYFVDVQCNLLDSLNSRLVIPLTQHRNLEKTNINNLCPQVTLNDESFVLLTHQMTNVPMSALKSPVTTIEHLRGEILEAIDILITGI